MKTSFKKLPSVIEPIRVAHNNAFLERAKKELKEEPTVGLNLFAYGSVVAGSAVKGTFSRRFDLNTRLRVESPFAVSDNLPIQTLSVAFTKLAINLEEVLTRFYGVSPDGYAQRKIEINKACEAYKKAKNCHALNTVEKEKTEAQLLTLTEAFLGDFIQPFVTDFQAFLKKHIKNGDALLSWLNLRATPKTAQECYSFWYKCLIGRGGIEEPPCLRINLSDELVDRENNELAISAIVISDPHLFAFDMRTPYSFSNLEEYLCHVYSENSQELDIRSTITEINHYHLKDTIFKNTTGSVGGFGADALPSLLMEYYADALRYLLHEKRSDLKPYGKAYETALVNERPKLLGHQHCRFNPARRTTFNATILRDSPDVLPYTHYGMLTQVVPFGVTHKEMIERIPKNHRTAIYDEILATDDGLTYVATEYYKVERYYDPATLTLVEKEPVLVRCLFSGANLTRATYDGVRTDGPSRQGFCVGVNITATGRSSALCRKEDYEHHELEYTKFKAPYAHYGRIVTPQVNSFSPLDQSLSKDEDASFKGGWYRINRHSTSDLFSRFSTYGDGDIQLDESAFPAGHAFIETAGHILLALSVKKKWIARGWMDATLPSIQISRTAHKSNPWPPENKDEIDSTRYMRENRLFDDRIAINLPYTMSTNLAFTHTYPVFKSLIINEALYSDTSHHAVIGDPFTEVGAANERITTLIKPGQERISKSMTLHKSVIAFIKENDNFIRRPHQEVGRGRYYSCTVPSRFANASELNRARPITATDLTFFTDYFAPVDLFEGSAHRLAKLLRAGYTYKELVEYGSQAYLQEGICSTDYVMYLDDYRSMCEQFDIKPKKFPQSLLIAHNLMTQHVRLNNHVLLNKQFDERAEELAPYQDTKVEQYILKVPETPADLIKEGSALNHCVGSYVGRHSTKQSTILFLREASKPDEPFITIELDARTGLVHQMKGYANKAATEILKAPDYRAVINTLMAKANRGFSVSA